MAPAKQLWTADMYRRMSSGASMVIVCFIILGVGSFFSLAGSESVLAFSGLVSSFIGALGTFQIRHVFKDLIEAAEPQARTQSAAGAWSAAQRTSQPQAAVNTVSEPGTPESYWEQQARGRRVSSLQDAPLAMPAAKNNKPVVKIDWEQWVGKKLLQKAGILIVLIGMLVFLKYSFDNRWIDELGRVFMSAVAAGVLIGAGEYFHRLYGKWSQTFTGGGLALLYLTVWVAHVLYAEPLAANYGLVVPAGLAFVLYAGITLVGALAAVRYNAQTIAWFTVLGGYLTPLLVNAQTDTTALLLYLAMLAGGLILLAWHQKWRYLNVAAFGFTQFYLYTSVYTAVPEFNDVYQVVTASAFFLLFSLLPVLYQFRLKKQADTTDIALIVLNGLAVFLPVVDAFGGWGSGYVGLVCFALAAFYLIFSVLALQNRGEDETLINTYLTGTVLLVAGGLFAELEREWVAAAWAPLSLLIAFVAVRLNRVGPWLLAGGLLTGALFFLLINMPFFTAGPEEIWHPFTSNWAIQSYVIFGSVIGWLKLSRHLPASILSPAAQPSLANVLHTILAATLFLAVTFEATRLNFDVDLVWTFAYIALGVVALMVFFFTESVVWFAAAFFVQILSLIFIFFVGDSGMAVFGSDPVQPLLHPGSHLSILALLATFAMIYMAQIKRERLSAGFPVHYMIAGIALAQIWVHVTVEITNFSETYDWSYLMYDRTLTAWWIFFALAAMCYALFRRSHGMAKASIALLAIPFISHHFSILWGQDRMIETMLWTVLSLGVAIVGARTKNKNLLWAGIIFLAAAAGIDMLAHLADIGAGLVRSSWWALAGLVIIIAGFVERESLLRRLAMLIFAATALKLLVIDFSGLETPVRIGASIMTGLLMIGASYLYQRFDSMLSPVSVDSKL